MGTTGQSITLANSIIGVGILAMPFCFQQCGVLLATLILLFMGLISRLCCYFLLKSAVLARRRNFEFLAFHVFGSAGKMAVEVGIIGFLMGTCIAYFVVVGDLGPQIISKMFNINQSSILRTSIMVIVSLVCVLPLGLLRNVDSLSNVSAATICFYFCLVIKVIAEAATQLPSGAWQERVQLWRPQGLLQCLPIFSMALFCQAQLFEIFESLPSLSLEKMNLVTKNAINICTAVYFTLGVFGYIAFSEKEISGNILMSLSPTLASDVIKLGFVMSLAFSFPLIIFPCRASLYSFLYKKVHSSQHDHIINHSIPESTFRCITVGIIAAALFVSVLLPSIELVLGLLGATIGVLICLVFPAAAFLNLTFKNTNERLLAKGVVILGLFIMVLGTYANLQAAEGQIERYDERFITQEKIDKIVEDFFEKRGRDDINSKPMAIEPIAIEPKKLNGNIMKDSEVQPPNPVPPESNSNELKRPETNMEKLNLNNIKNEKSVNDVLLPEKLKEEAADTISDSHPKNLKSKLNGAKILNGDTNNVNKVEEKSKPPPANEENKVEKIKLIKQQQLIETMKQHGEEQKELMQEQKEILDEIIKTKKEINVEKAKESESKVDAKKHQQLIDTIKQHGEEQKELMKEQKEILDEIKELKQNKDTDSLEAKKLAVESIKQIADIAIKSIGGVTEKPVGQPVEDKKVESLEKLTNEAVQKIVKKAAETLEAIQEINEKPDMPKPFIKAAYIKVENKIPQAEPKVETQHNAAKEAPVENGNPQDTIQNEDKSKQANVKRELLSNNAPDNDAKKSVETVESKIAAPVLSNNLIKNEIKQNIEQEKIAAPIAAAQHQNEIEPKNIVSIDNNVIEKQNLKGIEVKSHSHSHDEPKSYILGEDLQIKNPTNEGSKLNANVPLAIAMSDQAKLENNVQTKAKLNTDQNKPNFSVIDNSKIEVPKIDNLVRLKRDVVDCTQTISLEPADRNLCKALNLLPMENSIEILPKVDLNDRLSKMPLHINIGRSLKSFDDKKKR